MATNSLAIAWMSASLAPARQGERAPLGVHRGLLGRLLSGDYYVRSGPSTISLGEQDIQAYLATRFGAR